MQTGRLNRNCAGQEDTFILDFRNSPEEIFKAFKPYYEDTPSEPLTDAQHLYRLQYQIEETALIFEEEVTIFCSIYFKPVRKETGIKDPKRFGIDVWFDEDDIMAGSSIVTQINGALTEVMTCSSFIPHPVRSPPLMKM